MVKAKNIEEFLTVCQLVAFKGICERLQKDRIIKFTRPELASALYIDVIHITYVLKIMKLIGLADHIKVSSKGLVVELTDHQLLSELLESWQNE